MIRQTFLSMSTARTRILLAFMVALGLLGVAAPAAAQTELPGTVYTTRNVFLRAGAGMGFHVVAELPAGEALTTLGQSSVWINVRRADGTEGWVSGSYVTINPPGSGGGGGSSNAALYAIPPQPGDVAMVTAALLNVRKGPGVNAEVKDQLPNGELVTVLAKAGAWRQIQYRGTKQGWVNGQWLSGRINTVLIPAGGTPPSLPITTVITPPNATPLEVNIVTTPLLNVRTGPSTLYSVVTVVSQNEFVTVLAKSGGWRYIKTSNGTLGWSNIDGLTGCDCTLP